jgi:hypothetical protein
LRRSAVASPIPRLRTTPIFKVQLQQGFATGEMGYGRHLHGSNPKPLMSALGQKQTWPRIQPMSAIPPKAHIAEYDWDVRFVPKADIPHCPNHTSSDF